MSLSYAERCQKVSRVVKYMGFHDLGELLFACRDQATVPGICTDAWCDMILSVRGDEEGDLCPDCRRDTVRSILVVAGLQ
jgi:hypothetical protein